MLDTTMESEKQTDKKSAIEKKPSIDKEALMGAMAVKMTPPQLWQELNRAREVEEILEKHATTPIDWPGLHVGAVFEGKQTNESSEYGVNVVLKSVDLDRNYLCGYLTISGLTDMYPTLTTFFEAEIIGQDPLRGHRASASGAFTFRTGHRWRATSDVDFAHWSQFDAFAALLKDRGFDPNKQIVTWEDVDLDTLKPWSPQRLETPGLFMRWKEQFLVPDHTIERIEGASYEGFYYMFYDRAKQSLEGFYYHSADNKQLQRITLAYKAQCTWAHCNFR